MSKKKRAIATSWKIRPMPPAHKELPLDGGFSRHEYVTISQGFIPQQRTDKWFIYLDGEWLHFHRSQTGTCVYQLQILPFEDRYHAPRAIVNRDPSQYRSEDDEYDVAMIAYLIDTVLLGRFAPLPTPQGLRKEDQTRYRQDVMGKTDDNDRIDLGPVNGKE